MRRAKFVGHVASDLNTRPPFRSVSRAPQQSCDRRLMAIGAGIQAFVKVSYLIAACLGYMQRPTNGATIPKLISPTKGMNTRSCREHYKRTAQLMQHGRKHCYARPDRGDAKQNLGPESHVNRNREVTVAVA